MPSWRLKLPVRENIFLGQIGMVSRSSAQHNHTGFARQKSLRKNLNLGEGKPNFAVGKTLEAGFSREKWKLGAV
ncbi:MAG: hypothetical protein NTW80_02695 [Deltaproteobacteria bacterium]|nr:hypothetical protein [Deltaproteobacteria bacterium]